MLYLNKKYISLFFACNQEVGSLTSFLGDFFFMISLTVQCFTPNQLHRSKVFLPRVSVKLNIKKSPDFAVLGKHSAASDICQLDYRFFCFHFQSLRVVTVIAMVIVEPANYTMHSAWECNVKTNKRKTNTWFQVRNYFQCLYYIFYLNAALVSPLFFPSSLSVHNLFLLVTVRLEALPQLSAAANVLLLIPHVSSEVYNNLV